MSACPLFGEFRERKETAILKGMNIDTVATSTGITHVLELCGFQLEFAKIKGAKIIWHAKSSTFRAAKLKGFTVSVCPSFCVDMAWSIIKQSILSIEKVSTEVVA